MSEKYKETPIGWWSVTKPLEEFLVSHGAVVTQMKEKFAGLRCYYRRSWNGCYEKNYFVGGAVEFAEKLCSTMCQECGKQGAVDKSTGWLIVLCDEHNPVGGE